VARTLPQQPPTTTQPATNANPAVPLRIPSSPLNEFRRNLSSGHQPVKTFIQALQFLFTAKTPMPLAPW
jgi:hypothetical protein